MHLKNAGIKNFKGMKEMQIDFMPGFNLIKGETEKGKPPYLKHWQWD